VSGRWSGGEEMAAGSGGPWWAEGQVSLERLLGQ
jgi:hypothetical protein